MKFHVEVGFPKLLILPAGTHALQYSRHAIEQAKSDKYGDCSAGLPQLLNFSKVVIFEVESENRVLKKIVCRTAYNLDLDLILAISTEDSRNFVVKTVWLNDKSDTHSTLKADVYNSPESY